MADFDADTDQDAVDVKRSPLMIWMWNLFRFGVLTAVILITGVAVRIASIGYHQNAAMNHLRALGVKIRPDIGRVVPKWVRPIVTDARLEPYGRVQNLNGSDLKITDQDLADIKQLNGLEWLALNRCQITDEGIKQICGISTLKALRIDGTPVTDASLAYLANLKRLEVLSLNDTKVNGAGLDKLAALPRLRHLELEGDLLNEVALKNLKELKGLAHLRLGNTGLSSTEIDDLEHSLGIEIRRTSEPNMTVDVPPINANRPIELDSHRSRPRSAVPPENK